MLLQTGAIRLTFGLMAKAGQDDTDAKRLGAAIENERLKLGLSKSEAARRAGVSRTTWIDIENGRRANSNKTTLQLLEKALQLDRGALRRASVLGDPLNGAVSDVEAYTADNATAMRRRLVHLAATLSADEVREVVNYADGIHKQDFSSRFDSLDERMRAMADEIDRLKAGTPPPEGAGHDGKASVDGGPGTTRGRTA
jgi:transcriptional regulator with XRE-family HTH domain